MKNSAIRKVVISGVAALICIMIVQGYWLKNTFDHSAKAFEEKVNICLRNVAVQLSELKQMQLPALDLVNQIAQDYYVVNIREAIDANSLEFYLKKEFDAVGLHTDFEYGIYDCDTKDYVEEATLVGAMFMPTGSVQKNPPTGIGSATFFGGATYNRMYQNWYGYTSHGYEVTTTREGLKPGNTFTYQAGVGRHICSCPEEWIFAALLEVDGHYAGKDKNHGRSDPDSGGNVLLLIPSLWFSTQKITLQFGIGFPLTQHLNGGQRKNNYVIASNFGWTF